MQKSPSHLSSSSVLVYGRSVKLQTFVIEFNIADYFAGVRVYGLHDCHASAWNPAANQVYALNQLLPKALGVLGGIGLDLKR